MELAKNMFFSLAIATKDIFKEARFMRSNILGSWIEQYVTSYHSPMLPVNRLPRKVQEAIVILIQGAATKVRIQYFYPNFGLNPQKQNLPTIS